MRSKPVPTQVETLLPEGEFIYSRTDLKSYIVEANDAFAQISGYRREDMLGQPHNMVRHPDMPREAFADMWRDLQAGLPWRGLVKNLRSDGGFCWVVANASPVREKGRIVGYQSVRSRPSHEEVKAAEEAYRRLRAGDTSLRIVHGRVVPARIGMLHRLNSVDTLPMLAALMLLALALALLARPLSAGVVDALAPWLGGAGALLASWLLLVALPRQREELGRLDTHLDHLLCSGDLRTRIDTARHDRLGALIHKMDRFVSSVQATIQGMDDTAKQVAHVSTEVGQGVGNVQDAARIQSDATNSTAAAIQQITVSIGEVAGHAAETRTAAEQANEIALSGAALSTRATRNIHELAGTITAAARQVEKLGTQSAEVSRVTGVIREIADQTNLLALNAAIEAARAGEQGRGFAVVADEVRKLAERTTQATHDISTMIGAIRAEIDKAVDGMRSGAEQVGGSVDMVEQARSALEEVSQRMSTTLGMVHDITHSSAEQQNAMQLMASSVEKVASMTEQNMAVVVQTHGAVSSLDQAVERMRKSVGQFTL